jgi:hypothetical protein
MLQVIQVGVPLLVEKSLVFDRAEADTLLDEAARRSLFFAINFIETQCHGLETLEYLCGPIASISAEMTNISGKGYSTLALTLRFAKP